MRQRVGPWEHFRRGNAATILIVAEHARGIPSGAKAVDTANDGRMPEKSSLQ
jgi:hypothetical protein